jgi:hypothetical protein
MKMPQQDDKVEGEEPVGPQILDFYLSYLHGQPKHLPIEAKKALRLCCKKFKYFFDASIDDAFWYSNYNQPHAIFKGKFLRFSARYIEIDESPKFFMSLDLACRMLPSLKALDVQMSTGIPFIINGSLPESIGQLTSLTKLRVVMPSALSLPSSFSQLTLLETLALETSPTSFNDLLPLLGFKALIDLTIRVQNTELFGLTDFVLNFPKLKSLNVGGIGRDASAISENFGCLPLTSLVLYLENVSSLPESIVEMPSLIALHLSAREGLNPPPPPAWLGNLTALEKLTLSSFDLITLPDSISNLKHLDGLHLYTCMNLSRLPCSIGELESLEALKIRKCNAFRELPESIGNLRCLKNLWFFECESLIKLPTSLSRLNLDHLVICHCDQLVEPSVETLLQQFGTAFSYYSEKRGLVISNGQMPGVIETEEESSESGTDEDNDSDISGSETDDGEESE